jgi:long-chain acyl-CoA synthetase
MSLYFHNNSTNCLCSTVWIFLRIAYQLGQETATKSTSYDRAMNTSPSFLTGPTEPPLWNLTLGELLRQQADYGPSRPCIVFPEYNHRVTYQQLYHKTLTIAKGLLSAGICRGDRIGIFAGNCPSYVELLFAASHVGAALVVLNYTYTPAELKSALSHSGSCHLCDEATKP